VVEIELDLVGRGSNRLITSELELLNEVFVGVLGHLSAFISVEENVVNIEGGSNKGLLVGSRNGLGAGRSRQGFDGPEALTDGAEINVDFHLVVLEGNKGKGKAGVAAKPEKKRNVKGGLGEGIAGSANLGRPTGRGARSRDVGEGGVSDVGKLSGVANHLEVPTLLFGRHGDLVPDVHPITILAIDSLATNLNLDGRDELLTDVVQPTGINTTRDVHRLVDLGESHLKVGAVAEITVATDSAGNSATEIGLPRKCLFNTLHRKVCVASVRNLPEGDLRCAGKKNVLCAVGD